MPKRGKNVPMIAVVGYPETRQGRDLCASHTGGLRNR